MNNQLVGIGGAAFPSQPAAAYRTDSAPVKTGKG